ncbi:T-complex 10 C-terminal domain-containing protein, partial [Streptomyces africanus]|uniref:T-complex 10 C-terminal domain-containing protein n=1 Tax=Streptomyces africanus TaxID=231024 RepID=UPI001FC97E54
QPDERADGLTSALIGLHGWGEDEGEVVAAVGSNAYGHHSATPFLTLRSHPGGTRLMVTLVVLTADPVVNASAEGAGARVEADGSVEIRFPDGTREFVS